MRLCWQIVKEYDKVKVHPEMQKGGKLGRPLVGCWLGHTFCMGLLPVAHPDSSEHWWARFWEPIERHKLLNNKDNTAGQSHRVTVMQGDVSNKSRRICFEYTTMMDSRNHKQKTWVVPLLPALMWIQKIVGGGQFNTQKHAIQEAIEYCYQHDDNPKTDTYGQKGNQTVLTRTSPL